MIADPSITGTDGHSLACTCNDGFRLAAQSCSRTSALCADYSCTACTSSTMPTADKSTCLPCDPATASYSNGVGRCVCNNADYVLVDSDAAGNLRTDITCLPCPTGTAVVSADPFTCKSCSDDGSMQVGWVLGWLAQTLENEVGWLGRSTAAPASTHSLPVVGGRKQSICA